MPEMFQTLVRTMERHSLLHAACRGCNHIKTFSSLAAVKTFGPDATPVDVRNRLVCSKCGERKRIDIWVV